MTINEETFKNCEIKDIYFKNEADFYDRDKPEHFVLIFFVTYQLTLEDKSYWYPMFEAA